MKEMDERPGISMVFYNVIQSASYFGKSNMLPFITCRMVQLTMETDPCKYSIMGFVYYAIADRKGCNELLEEAIPYNREVA